MKMQFLVANIAYQDRVKVFIRCTSSKGSAVQRLERMRVMKQHRMCDSILALLGITAVAVYVLACRPSFSPDGSRIVFTSFDTDAKQATVLCYDVKAKTLETLYQTATVDKIHIPDPLPQPGKKQEADPSPSLSLDNSTEPYLVAAQWLPDGKRIAINALSYVLTLPVGSAGPPRMFQLQNILDSGTLMRDFPILGRYQFIPDKEFLLRLDLETGEMLAAPDKKEYILMGEGNQLWYLAASDIVEGSGSSEAKAENVEIGRLHPETLATTPLFKMKGVEQFGDLTGFAAFSRDGSRLALSTLFSKTPKLLLLRNNKLEKTVALAKEDSRISVGNLEWSADGKTVFMAYGRDKENNTPGRYGILEAHIDGGEVRDIPLFTADSDDGWTALYQITMSPDGRTLAGSSTCFDNSDIKSEERALYLVDLGSAARKVTKVPVAPDRPGKATPAK
jgi:hypothetical protein